MTGLGNGRRLKRTVASGLRGFSGERRVWCHAHGRVEDQVWCVTHGRWESTEHGGQTTGVE